MSLRRPASTDAVKPVTPAARALASELAQIDLSKFRFKFGGVAIAAAILLFIFSHFLPITQYFERDFVDRAWFLTKVLIVVGLAFCGKEVVEAFATGIKAFFKSPPS